MTWKNIPCSPTLPALFKACPNGWAEIEFTYSPGAPTADPPQDADVSIAVGRTRGIEWDDMLGGPCRASYQDLLGALLDDLREPPLGVPSQDFVLLVRMVHGAGPCNTCGRERGPAETSWWCVQTQPDSASDWVGCTGCFPFVPRLETNWGIDGKPVVCVGEVRYGLAAAIEHKYDSLSKDD